MSIHSKVVSFNREILSIQERPVGLMSPNEFNLSMRQLREEISEMEDEYDRGNLVGVVDGMIDLHFFLLGVIYKHGLKEELYEKLFHEVYSANMEKKAGVKKGREGFGNAADAVKPEGWIPPEERLARILENHMDGVKDANEA